MTSPNDIGNHDPRAGKHLQAGHHALRASDQSLQAGDREYTAFVGPPEEYDLMGATQFRLLTNLGLRHNHRVLDIGCGSLRAGRLLIQYLDPGGYHGLEPNKWLIDGAIDHQIGHDTLALKRPVFLHHDTFSTREFGIQFDYVLAQSILSHAGTDLVATILEGIALALSSDGLALVTFMEPRLPAASDDVHGWVYPELVRYRPKDITGHARRAGLYSCRLRWRHPRQRWYALALRRDRLPWVAARWTEGRVWLTPYLSAYDRARLLLDARFARSDAGAMREVDPRSR